MARRHIVYIPGKNPKPPAEEHQKYIWRALIEGVRRAEPDVVDDLSKHEDSFNFIGWNFLYYQEQDTMSRHLPWIDAQLNKHGPTEQDIEESKSWHRKLDHLIYSIVDYFPFIIKILRGELRSTAEETNRYFENHGKIASGVREQLKEVLRPLLEDEEDRVLLVAHSLGSVISYDALWTLSQLEQLPGKVDTFITMGSPLGMKYVRRRLLGSSRKGKQKYPDNIRRWVNVAAEGDVTALDRNFSEDFSEMITLGNVELIEDHCDGIYNYFREKDGLNTHRSYGYLVNPIVGKTIADWWTANDDGNNEK